MCGVKVNESKKTEELSVQQLARKWSRSVLTTPEPAWGSVAAGRRDMVHMMFGSSVFQWPVM